MLSKIILWATGIILGVYGIACLVSPPLAAGYIGYSITNADIFIETSAMYGGLQAGFGLLCIMGALNSSYTRASLFAVVFVVGGLALGRAIGLATAVGDPTSYTYGAITYEIITTVLAIICLRR